MIWFGPAGNGDSFKTQGFKHIYQTPEYLANMGLNAFEYQCGRGVNVNPDNCEKLKILAHEKGIRLSLHAPYFISLSGIEEEKRLGSLKYIYDSAKAARLIGADRITVHTGSCSKITRNQALELARDTVSRARKMLDDYGLEDIIICLETMGKINQLGTLEEVTDLCTVDERIIPCIDFGHLNARTLGKVNSFEAYEHIIRHMCEKLGEYRGTHFHSHFSKIQYTEGGEKCHLTFDDDIYGPDFEPLADCLIKYNCEPVIICESAGTQAEDAAKMRLIYESKI